MKTKFFRCDPTVGRYLDAHQEKIDDWLNERKTMVEVIDIRPLLSSTSKESVPVVLVTQILYRDLVIPYEKLGG